MWTPLADTKEEGWKDDGVVYPTAEDQTIGPALTDMQPGDWMILGKVFERKTNRQIAEEMGISVATVVKVRGSFHFKQAILVIEERIADRIARGEFGVLAMAKASAIGAMKRIVGMSKECHTDAVKFNANKMILEIAGVQAPKPLAPEPVERLVDRMTAAEAKEFYETGHFPERFHDQLARIAVASVEQAERKRWTPQIDAPELVAGEEQREVEQSPATEEVEP